jgi:CRP-like cAMP-binding protein
MLATAQSGADFRSLNDKVKQQFRGVLSAVSIESRLIELSAAPAAQFRAMPRNLVGVVETGLVSVLHGNTVVSVLEVGDLVIPDTDFLPSGVGPLLYGSEGGAFIRGYDRDAFLADIAVHESSRNQWMAVLSQHVSLLMRLNALHIREAVGMGGTPEIYPAGTIIIQQGDPADDIFSMVEGLAEVLVNDMPVAKIRPGELFGTMAALTGSHRNATVRAMESCSVIRVAKDRFFELIRSRPAAVQGLLVDMAQSITELNEEVVALRRKNSAS